ncbi:hypothetical protein ACVWY0_003212 [Arthrobacter sp. UYNi723]
MSIKASDNPAWRKRWRIENERGLKRIVDPDKAQDHVQAMVRDHGVSLRGIAEAAGVSAFIISDLNRNIKQAIHRDTEKAILAVTAEAVLARPNAEGFVPNIGGRRRIQALMAMGWRHQDLKPMLGLNTANIVHQQGEWFTKRKHDAIKELYDRLWDKRGPAGTLSINRIIKAGYAPPLAWDDETIDDPNAVPDFGAKAPGRGPAAEGTVSKADTLLEDVEFLLSEGLTWEAITDRLGIVPKSLDKNLRRLDRADLIRRAKTMTERQAYARAS